MKKLGLVLLLLIGSLTVQAQEIEWQTDIKKAAALSKETQKPLLLFFTGSDWCGWCIRLQKEVLKTTEFAEWAQKNVILVELDYPRRTAQSPELKAQNAELQRFFGIRGYPTIWFANATTDNDGQVAFTQLGKTGYVAGGPSAWLSVANGILKK